MMEEEEEAGENRDTVGARAATAVFLGEMAQRIRDADWRAEVEEIAQMTPDDDYLLHYMIQEIPFIAKDTFLVKEANIRTGLESINHGLESSPIHRALIRACARMAGKCELTVGRKTGKAYPVTVEQLKRAAAAARKTKSPALTQAVAFGLTCFSTVSRSGEIMSLLTTDVRRVREGYEITIRRSKTRDEPMVKLVPLLAAGGLSPARWLRAHLNDIQTEGPLWRSIQHTESLLRDNCLPLTATRWRRWEMIMDVNEVFKATGHSFRRGAVVHMIDEGRSPLVIQALGGWKSIDSVNRYCEEAIRISQHALQRRT
ncbi:hypothetical protein J8273_0258 [Carpediemonas membranifera]|uniref:Tyr recombinase domain-containing protein n=1 Tax=Carpediemonas membranifera TaxID=201153 RepID=A0A8J6B631_9EUKA|nr:hypothetical protein J8273_0258 [Carpediemonas membranifera]|eukprot:KAG9395044.1 hypothetical protein J8273_0258 [Carpediemonas membranifera]